MGIGCLTTSCGAGLDEACIGVEESRASLASPKVSNSGTSVERVELCAAIEDLDVAGRAIDLGAGGAAKVIGERHRAVHETVAGLLAPGDAVRGARPGHARVDDVGADGSAPRGRLHRAGVGIEGVAGRLSPAA